MKNSVPLLGIGAALAGALMVNGANAQERNDRSLLALYHACQAQAEEPGSFCKGYLSGAADTLTAFGAGGHKAGLCAPSYNPAELQRIFMAWVPEHKELWELDMFAGVQAAFQEQWPCN